MLAKHNYTFFTFYVAFSLLSLDLRGQQLCANSTVCFKNGEEVRYEVYYHWGMVWANAGSACFKVEKEIIKNQSYFHFTGTGSTHKNYDWFYKVRDQYESWADTSSLAPYRYIRNTKEGSIITYNDNYFNQVLKRVYAYSVGKKGKIQKDTIKLGNCTFDVMTMIYYARSIDYSIYKLNDKIPISLYLDGKIYNLSITYLGRETISTILGKTDCIKFRPQLIEGTIFKGGNDMTVWVTNDKNKIPVYIETPIAVGEIQVKLSSVHGQKY